MLTTQDKDYIQQVNNALHQEMREDFEGLERKFGAHMERIEDLFQHFAEIIMSHIDKKFEVVTAHETRITTLEHDVNEIRADQTLHTSQK